MNKEAKNKEAKNKEAKNKEEKNKRLEELYFLYFRGEWEDLEKRIKEEIHEAQSKGKNRTLIEAVKLLGWISLHKTGSPGWKTVMGLLQQEMEQTDPYLQQMAACSYTMLQMVAGGAAVSEMITEKEWKVVSYNKEVCVVGGDLQPELITEVILTKISSFICRGDFAEALNLMDLAQDVYQLQWADPVEIHIKLCRACCWKFLGYEERAEAFAAEAAAEMDRTGFWGIAVNFYETLDREILKAAERYGAATAEFIREKGMEYVENIAYMRSMISAEEENECLTRREKEVAQLAASGMKNTEIAETLGIKANTVKYHLAHAYAKLEVNDRMKLREKLQSKETKSINWTEIKNGKTHPNG